MSRVGDLGDTTVAEEKVFFPKRHLFSYGVFTGAKTSCHSLDITEITNDNYPINSRAVAVQQSSFSSFCKWC
ncbi:hypothetical protein F2P79_001704 [Pimephales promelas]|nr:hypothetical protein F2P79_001704 [Pimephales promelas]